MPLTARQLRQPPAIKAISRVLYFANIIYNRKEELGEYFSLLGLLSSKLLYNLYIS